MPRPENYHIEQKISLDQYYWLIRVEQHTKVQNKTIIYLV
jgi:hypothetical protein